MEETIARRKTQADKRKEDARQEEEKRVSDEHRDMIRRKFISDMQQKIK